MTFLSTFNRHHPNSAESKSGIDHLSLVTLPVYALVTFLSQNPAIAENSNGKPEAIRTQIELCQRLEQRQNELLSNGTDIAQLGEPLNSDNAQNISQAQLGNNAELRQVRVDLSVNGCNDSSEQEELE